MLSTTTDPRADARTTYSPPENRTSEASDDRRSRSAGPGRVHSDRGVSRIDSSKTDSDGYGFPELPDSLEKDLVRVFKLLSDETRLRILLYLARENELHVTALCERLRQSQPAVSHHLALLRTAGLIAPRRDGKHNYYSIRQNRFHGLLAEFFQEVRDPETDEIEFETFVLGRKG